MQFFIWWLGVVSNRHTWIVLSSTRGNEYIIVKKHEKPLVRQSGLNLRMVNDRNLQLRVMMYSYKLKTKKYVLAKAVAWLS